MSDERDFLEDQLQYICARLEVHPVSTEIGTAWVFHLNRVRAALARLDRIKRYDHAEVVRLYRESWREDHQGPRHEASEHYAMARAQHQQALRYLAKIHGRRDSESHDDFVARFEPLMFAMEDQKARQLAMQRYWREVSPPDYDEDDDEEYSSDVPF